MRKHFTPALAIAFLALFFALTGGAYAAHHYIITNTKQIKPNVMRALKGNRGEPGADGPQGSPGITNITEVTGGDLTLPPGTYGGAPIAACPPGSVVIGTGFTGPFDEVGGFVLSYHSFVGGYFENRSLIALTGHVQAICAQMQGAAAVRSTPRLDRRQFEADVAKERATH
jgi:hypothetical protein